MAEAGHVGGVGNAMGNFGQEAEHKGVVHTCCPQGGEKGERNVPTLIPGNTQNNLWEH